MKYFNHHAILVILKNLSVIYKLYKVSNVKSKKFQDLRNENVSAKRGVSTSQSLGKKTEFHRVKVEKYFEDIARGTLSELEEGKNENARDKTLALVSSQSIILPRTMENAPGPFQPIRTHAENSVHTQLLGVQAEVKGV